MYLKICLIIAGFALVALFVFKVPLGSVASVGILLICPLMHIVMMKSMGHNDKKGSKKSCH